MSSSQPSTTVPLSVPFTIDTVLSGMLAFPDSPDIYRIRVSREHAGNSGGPTVKYLAAPNTARLFAGPVDAQQRRLTNLAFDHVPAGDWVVGRLAAPAEGGAEAKLELASTDDGPDALADLDLGSADPAWCGTTIDEADCPEPPAGARWTTVANSAGQEVTVPKPTELQCMGYLSAAVVPAPPQGVDAEVVVRVSEWMPGHWEGIENEARTHHIIATRDPGLAPRFLAYVTENCRPRRVVGFLLEHVPRAREAGLADLDKCRAVLARLHALGIPLRRLARESFLVREDGSVLVRGPFDGSPDEGVGEEVLQAEMESLERVLAQSPSAFERQAAKMLARADPGRVDMLSAFQKAHGFIVPFAVWQESRAGRITLTVEEHGILAKECEDSGFKWTKEMQERAEKRFGPSATQGVGA
ncbi:uncharacterized protein B0H64DRAFT_2127 [Chaetomium fimeti]|uniref:Aminoglycoside phosphotransferase domain-containing protein n=1 Tax=Chaetomium fimeti TaxID=1854472 RepID=A0AAE0LWD5_9PEZI|nr:hypothetical protein B0H64DRAFT_2127 [Chaetomium fimeti]